MLIVLSALADFHMEKPAKPTNYAADILNDVNQCRKAFKNITEKKDNYFIPISNALACYYGPLDKTSVDQALKWSQSNTSNESHVLVVKSPGGDANLGILLGSSLLSHHTTVAVDDICLSSCANYIFLPAFKKYITPYSLVVFHGGVAKSMVADILQSNIADEQKELAKNSLKILYYKQDKLFKLGNINGTFLENYYNAKKFSKKDLLNCTNRKLDVTGIILTPHQYKIIGADVEGYIASSVDDLLASLSRQGKNDKSLCIAPYYLFKNIKISHRQL